MFTAGCAIANVFPLLSFFFFFCLPVFSHFYNEHTLEIRKYKSCGYMWNSIWAPNKQTPVGERGPN